jgi:hypothetical protein
MRFVRRLLLAIAALLALAVALAYALPRHVIITRSITIDAAPDKVFPLVNSLSAGARWSPWLAHDPETALVFDGPDAGVGATMRWTSDKVGSGAQVITASTPNAHVASALDFGDMGTAQAAFDLTPAGTGTLVTWSLDADMGNGPVGRWMGLMMDRWVGADYEQGLANLKALVEGG